MNEKIKNRNGMEIISSFFTAIGIVDIKKNSYQIYKIKDNIESPLPLEGVYSEGVDIVINALVALEDRQSMKEFLDASTVMERLKNDSNIAKEFHRLDGKWSIMNIAPDYIDGKKSKDTFILSLQNSYKDMVKYDNEVKEKNETKDLLQILGGSYVCVAYVDAINDYIEFKKPTVLRGVLSEINKTKYSESVQRLIKEYVFEKDREKLIKQISLDNLKKVLLEKKQIKINFEGMLDENILDTHFCLQFVRSTTNSDILVMGVTSIQETVEESLKKDALLAALTADYDYVFLCDIDKDEFIIEKTTMNSRSEIVELLHDSSSITKTLKKYIETYIAPSEAKKISLLTNVDFIKKEVLSKKNVTYRYQVKDNKEGLKYFCMHIVSVSTKDRNLAVMGVRWEDEAVKEELKQKQELEKQMKIISALNNSNESTYRLDLINDKYEEIKANKDFRMIVGESGIFSKNLPKIVDEFINEKEKKGVIEFCRIDTLKARLKNKSIIEYDFLDKTGIWNRIAFIEAERNQDGDVTSLLFTIRLVDEEKVKELRAQRKLDEAYKALSKYQKRIETTLEGAKMGLWTLEIKENARPRLICNKTTLDILGLDSIYTPEEVYQEVCDRVYPDDVEKFKNYLELIEDGFGEIVYQWNHPTLGSTYMRCGGWRDKSHKEMLYFRGYHANVTETKFKEMEQQEKLQHAYEEAKRADAAKSDFLAHISHDIRTPINGITGMLEIAKRNIDDKERLLNCIEKISSSSNYLLTLVNDVLSMSKLETGEISLQNVPFNIKELFDEIHNINQIKIDDLGLHLNSKIDIQHPFLIGSPKHIQQIVINLISNAIKYNKPNGSINVDCLETGFKDNRAHFCFVVEDTGIGMSKKFLKTIFDPFVQEANDARSRYQGVGLGMAIVKRLVDKMGGTISVESERNVGTKFVVEMDFEVDNNASIEVEVTKKKVSIENVKVLVVEDNELNMEIVVYLLEEAGAIVSKATNGKEAVDKFISRPPGTFDVILMDIMMPIMNGIAATKEIRTSNRKDALTIPIIAMTANAFIEDQKKYKEAGMNGFISKPVDIESMMKMISKYR